MRTIIKFGFLILASLIPSLVVAQDVYTPVAGNGSVSLLSDMYGSLVNGTGSGAFGDMFLILNNAILAMAGLFGGWSLLSSIVDTANHGSINGQNQLSKFWYPIRMVLFTAFIIPIQSGFCLIQVILMWGILQGEGLADLLWQNWIQTGSTKVIVNNPSVSMLAKNVFLIQVCQEASALDNSKSSPEALVSMPVLDPTDTDGQGTMIFNSSYRMAGCGKINFNQNGTPSTIAQDPKNALFNHNNWVDPDNSGIKASHIGATQKMLEDFRPLAKKVANYDSTTMDFKTLSTEFSTVFNSAISNYQDTVRLSAEAPSTTAIKNSTSSEGWFTAGLYTLRLAKIQNSISTAIGLIPSIEGPMSTPYAFDNYLEAVGRAEGIINLNPDAKKSGISGLASNSSGVDSTGGVVGRFVSSAVTGLDLSTLEYNDKNPLLFAESLGDRLFTTSEVLTTGLVAASLAETAVSSLTPIKSNVVSSISPLLTTFIVMFGIMGFTFQYLIVNLPAMTFVFTSFWFHVVVFETLLAAPLLFAIQLGSKDESGLVGGARQSMLLLVRVIFYPFLMIAGLICAQVISQLFLQGFVNPIFAKSLLANMDGASGFKALFGFIGATIILCIVYLGILKKAYSLINLLPDNILEFLGNRGTLSTHGESGSQALQTGTLAVSQNLGSIANAGSKLGGAKMGLNNKAKEKSEPTAPNKPE